MNLTYKEAEQFLFEQLPVFSSIGAPAYKNNLDTTRQLDNYFHNPHKNYKTIHIAGTNGKGSVSNFIASVLQEAGYKTGLYTSPHILDFKERIRINGQKITEQFVKDFVNKYSEIFQPMHPSFFELTSAMCFEYFSQEKVDVGVIEVGMGGRLDSTNIITPILSVITNIALDHTQFLGTTLKEIAGEKAGIIKKGVPVVIGESDIKTNSVFLAKADELEAPIILASNQMSATSGQISEDGTQVFNVFRCGEPVYHGLKCSQLGVYQQKNIVTALSALEQLQRLGLNISEQNIYDGFKNVNKNTGFYGRWQIVSQNPLTVCDTGHNYAGFQYNVNQINSQKCNQLRIVIGFVKDKDIASILRILPKNAIYYFVNANIKRALLAEELKRQAEYFGLVGKAYSSVKEGFDAAKNDASEDDFIFVGGSNFVVSEAF
ncbi:MAG: bifunctional folylpolyglutamate synthase/dihydrofolate synthase [Bacteroidales bacterium]|nr:bifunctional folylpolyglutamate synthase/dihydrofolate synthase [Bacteroidales bacterium]